MTIPARTRRFTKRSVNGDIPDQNKRCSRRRTNAAVDEATSTARRSRRGREQTDRGQTATGTDTIRRPPGKHLPTAIPHSATQADPNWRPATPHSGSNRRIDGGQSDRSRPPFFFFFFFLDAIAAQRRSREGLAADESGGLSLEAVIRWSVIRWERYRSACFDGDVRSNSRLRLVIRGCGIRIVR